MQNYIFILYFTWYGYETLSLHPNRRTQFEGTTEKSAGENICSYERGSMRRLEKMHKEELHSSSPNIIRMAMPRKRREAGYVVCMEKITLCTKLV
jgi:hypothetical protein